MLINAMDQLWWNLHSPELYSLLITCVYGFLSLLMTFLNKLVITRFFDYPIIIMMLQMALAFLSMEFPR